MKKIQILGAGCAKCKMLYQTFADVIAEEKIDAELEKVEDINRIVAMGVIMTPGVAIDGVVVSKGKSLSKAEVLTLLKQ